MITALAPFLPDHPAAVECQDKVLAVLRFYAEGGYQRGTANDKHHPMGKTTLHKYLHEVTTAILQLEEEYIVFPNTPQERQRVSLGYVCNKILILKRFFTLV